MATFYDKYAQLEVLESGSDVAHAASTCTLFASGTATGASLYFFKGNGDKVDLAGGGTMTADGDTGGTVSVDLSTDTFDIAGGTGCDTVIAKSGTDVTLTINLDMGEITEAAIDVSTDYGVYIDGGATGTTRKDSWADIATAQAGTVTTTGLAASSGVFKWDLQNWTALATVADADLVGIDDGASGTLRKMTRANFLGSAAAAFSNGLTTTTLGATGDVDLGNATSDTITATGRFDSDVVPSTDSARDLGTSALQWAEAHIDAGYIDDITATGTSTLTTVDINGGAIDGTIIGAASAAAGTFAALVGTSLNCSDGNITNVGSIALDSISADDGSSFSMGTNWTNASRTVADMGIVTTMDLNGGSIDGTIIGAASAAAGTFAALVGTSLSVSDGNVTNVGVLECDTVQSDGDATGLNINFDGNTGTNLISMANSLASALDITQGGNSFLKFDTNDDYTTAGKEFFMTAGTSVGASGWLRFGNNSSASDAQLFVQDNALVISGSVASGVGKTYLSGALVVSGNLTVGQGAANGSDLTLQAAITGDIMPSADDTYDLGHSSNEFQDLYLDGIAYVDQLGTDGDPTTAYISGGELDNCVIGGETAAAATVTTLQCNGAVTVGSDGSGLNFTLYGGAANEDVVYSAANHTLTWTDSSNATHITIGGDASSEYAIDVATGSNNKNKVRAAAFVTYSDERLKDDVKPLRNALKTVNSLKAVNFTWKKDGSKDFGFLAQDLQKVVPQAVHGNETGLFGVDYGRLTAVLVSAIQEQSLEIAALKAEIEKK